MRVTKSDTLVASVRYYSDLAWRPLKNPNVQFRIVWLGFIVSDSDYLVFLPVQWSVLLPSAVSLGNLWHVIFQFPLQLKNILMHRTQSQLDLLFS